MTAPFDLNLRHLRALSAITASGSLSRAAETVGLSQPALTQGMSKLERQIGVRLFERRSNGVAPTMAGHHLANRAARAFDFLAAGVRSSSRAANRGFARPEWLMTATQLEAFLHFADTQSFVAAGLSSGLSQPAVHRAVRELEQVCAVPFVERKGRRVGLTEAGRKMARGVRLSAREIAAGIAEARGDAHDGGPIVVGAMPLSRALVLPRALARLLAANSETIVDVVEGSWRELIEPLADGIIDFTVGALRSEAPQDLVQTPLFSDQLAVFGRVGHPLAKPEVSLDDLASQPWIVGLKGTPLRTHWEALFAGRDLPRVPIECGSVIVIRGVLAQSDLLTLLSPDQVAPEIASGMLVQVGPLLSRAVRTIGITTRRDWRPTAAQQALIEEIKAAAIATRTQEIG